MPYDLIAAAEPPGPKTLAQLVPHRDLVTLTVQTAPPRPVQETIQVGLEGRDRDGFLTGWICGHPEHSAAHGLRFGAKVRFREPHIQGISRTI